MNDHIFGYWDDHVGDAEKNSKSTPIDMLENEGSDIYTEAELRDLKFWDVTLMDGLDEESWDDLEYLEQTYYDRIEFEKTNEFINWQIEIMEDTKNCETKEKRFYGVVRVKKADLISPSESQILNYYIDYGYNTISEILNDYTEDEMLREWYVNTNFTDEFSNYREAKNINSLEWDSEYEEVEVISEEEWNDFKKNTW
jgi:hypothetical protein